MPKGKGNECGFPIKKVGIPRIYSAFPSSVRKSGNRRNLHTPWMEFLGSRQEKGDPPDE
jgi:hypothetical protein